MAHNYYGQSNTYVNGTYGTQPLWTIQHVCQWDIWHTTNYGRTHLFTIRPYDTKSNNTYNMYITSAHTTHQRNLNLPDQITLTIIGLLITCVTRTTYTTYHSIAVEAQPPKQLTLTTIRLLTIYATCTTYRTYHIINYRGSASQNRAVSTEYYNIPLNHQMQSCKT